MALACKYCILTKGLRGSDISKCPQNEEELAQHIESEHHIPVRRKNETAAECNERFQRENPEAGGENCKCPRCQVERDIQKTFERVV